LKRYRVDRAEDSRKGIRRPDTVPSLAKWFYDYAGGDDRRGDEPGPGKLLTIMATILVAHSAAVDVSAFQSVTAEGMLPVRAGQRVRLHIVPSRPACLYLLWVQPGGLVLPLFPWKGRIPAAGQNIPRKDLMLPPKASWSFEDTPGLETLAAFASAEPLPQRSLIGLVQDFTVLEPIRDVGDGPFEDNLEATCGVTAGAPVRLNLSDPQPLVERSQAVCARHQHIARQLAEHFVAGQFLSFGNAGLGT
jgi:hypothetical protein